MSSIDCSETALSNERDVWRFLILRVVRGVLDLAILEATIHRVAFDVISLLFFKLERISFRISSDYEFITASYITRTEFGDWELTTALIATAFFHGDFSQLMLSVISLTLWRVVVERFLNGNVKFSLTWNGEFWLFFLSLSVCPYLFVCSFNLSVWYQVLFDMICLLGTSFCILHSFLFGLLFLYLLVLNVFQPFFVYPFLFQFHSCFLCFSLSFFSFCVCQWVFQFWSTHFTSSCSSVFL